jgi:glycosyltransferase involved in cell wall biosynthesis
MSNCAGCVSVVIPTFHREKLLLEAVDSALRQPVLEVLVMDDSPEGSARTIIEQRAQKEPRLSYRQMPIPSGGLVGRVYNEGARHTRGEMIHFLDDDDHLMDGAVAALAELLARSSVGMAFGRVVPFGRDPAHVAKMQSYYDRARKAGNWIRDGRYRFAAQMLFGEWPLVSGACMVRRSAFEAVNGRNPHLKLYDDIDFALRVARFGGVSFLDQDVLHYRIGESSLTNKLLQQDDIPEIRAEYLRLARQYRKQHGGGFEYRMLWGLYKLHQKSSGE